MPSSLTLSDDVNSPSQEEEDLQSLILLAVRPLLRVMCRATLPTILDGATSVDGNPKEVK